MALTRRLLRACSRIRNLIPRKLSLDARLRFYSSRPFVPDPHAEIEEIDPEQPMVETNHDAVVTNDGCFARCIYYGFDMKKLHTYMHEQLREGVVEKVQKYTVGQDTDAMYALHGGGHVFYFSNGATVFWGIPEDKRVRILANASKFSVRKPGNQRVLTAVQEESVFAHDFEVEIKPSLQRTTFKNDVIVVPAWENVFEMFAVSYGLAQSSQLAMFEHYVGDLIDRTGDLPSAIIENDKSYKKLPLSKIKLLVSELLDVRFNINIRSEILDTPHVVWENAELAPIYDKTIREVQLNKRHRLINARLEIIKETLEILNSERQNSIGHNLERYIIYLIGIEILLSIPTHFFSDLGTYLSS